MKIKHTVHKIKYDLINIDTDFMLKYMRNKVQEYTIQNQLLFCILDVEAVKHNTQDDILMVRTKIANSATYSRFFNRYDLEHLTQHPLKSIMTPEQIYEDCIHSLLLELDFELFQLRGK